MERKTSLLIMAAGIGSRFGGGIKQLEPVGLHDEIIMDYSIHDALEAKTSLLIMAAGIGSRFGGGIKQLEPVGLHDEIIMDYSIHDALEAGFNKIILVIRKDIEADFRERIGNRLENICGRLGVELVYAFQDMNDVPGEVPLFL